MRAFHALIIALACCSSIALAGETTIYRYDENGRLVLMTSTGSNGDRIVGLRYDAEGNRKRYRAANGTTLPPSSVITAVDDYVTVSSCYSDGFDVLANDSDSDGDPLTIISVSTSSGIGDVSTDGAYVTWNPYGSTGYEYVTYVVSDGDGNMATGTAILDVRSCW